jgi:HPt (histidine-containing phosphotransfer) domain-containing protein
MTRGWAWVIDGQASRRLLIASQLENLAYRVREMAGLEEAAGLPRPQLLVLDCDLVCGPGVAFLAGIRAAESAMRPYDPAQRLPVLGLIDDPEDAAWARGLGVDSVLAMPAQAGDLAHLLGRMTEIKAALPVFDEGVLKRLAGPESEVFQRLILLFLDSLRPCWQRLNKAIESGALDEAEHQAHRMAGMALSAGAMEAGSLCRLFERAIREAQVETGRLAEALAFAMARLEEQVAPLAAKE